MEESVAELVALAGKLVNQGEWDEAEKVWQSVLRKQPANPQALLSIGVHALRRGELPGALNWLKKAQDAAPRDPFVRLTIAKAHQESRSPEQEIEAIQSALAIDAYFLPALLAKADWVERHRGATSAAVIYASALKIAPDEAYWPGSLREHLLRAKSRVAVHIDALYGHLLGGLRAGNLDIESESVPRWTEAASIMAGRSQPYRQQCNQLYVPYLSERPFHDPSEFPWTGELESRFREIRAEALEVLTTNRAGFSPYINYQPGEPVNQWKELNHSMQWSTFQLWGGGRPVNENLERCPITAKALAAVSMAHIDGLCPNAMFSVLAPKAHIPPHTGETNARLVAHLPLVVPAGCTFRVGFEERRWVEGKLMIFNDTIEHEAKNQSSEERIVLIFDVWHPQLDQVERGVVNTLCAASRAYHVGTG